MSIRIPSIGVSSHVIPLGLLPDGSLQTPADYGEAGWWSGGPTPGAVGPAVIVGHVDSTAGPAVFFHLRDLKPGDLVWVTRADGAKVSFVVRRLEQVAKAQFPTKEVYGPQPYATLRLITCGGTFDRSTGHYLDNVIVFADAA
jgi:sortase (surface protein transpeptidase)